MLLLHSKISNQCRHLHPIYLLCCYKNTKVSLFYIGFSLILLSACMNSSSMSFGFCFLRNLTIIITSSLHMTEKCVHVRASPVIHACGHWQKNKVATKDHHKQHKMCTQYKPKLNSCPFWQKGFFLKKFGNNYLGSLGGPA